VLRREKLARPAIYSIRHHPRRTGLRLECRLIAEENISQPIQHALFQLLCLGIIGLFIGAVVLALSYKLFLAWVTEESGSDTIRESEERASAA
jgi:hypothetical protein